MISNKHKEIVIIKFLKLARLITKKIRLVYIVIRLSLVSFSAARGAEASASLAYYGFFSLFPMLLFLIAVGGYFMQIEGVFQLVTTFFNELFPFSENFIADAIQQVIKLRGPVTFIGLIGLFWSATAYFVVLTRNIDRAWPHGRTRNYIQQRVTAFKMVAVVGVLLMMFLMTNTLAGILPKLFSLIPISEAIKASFFFKSIPRIIAWFVTYVIFVNLYRWTPASRISWKSVFWGAGIAALFWQLAAGGFSWILKSGLINYQLIYGSLGSISALMFWFYIGGFIILYGAHLIAALEHVRKKPQENELEPELTDTP